MARFATLLVLVLLSSPKPLVASDEYEYHHENVMGTSLELRVNAADAKAASEAEARVLAEIDRFNRIFNGYDPSSEFRRWLASKNLAVAVSNELLEVLDASDHWKAFTGGAFDPGAEAFSRLWARSSDRDRPPTAAELDSARALVARPAWRLDLVAKTAERLSDCPLTFNAIAKGYIVEKACAAGMNGGRGIRGLLLNVGGDLRVAGDESWTVGIVDPSHDSESTLPLTTVEVKNRAVATSGRHHRGYRIQGLWYSHILDPRTGLAADAVAGATVIADRSADADALATAFNVLPVAESLRLADSLPGVACLIVQTDGRIAKSRRWGDFEKKPLLARAEDTPKPAEKAASWGDQFELAVDFEINRPEAEPGRYRRPYVAVWVENKDGFPVRNLALWVSQGGAGPFQWAPDLRRWFRSDKVRKKVDKREMIFVMSRPTRPPGKYTVIWDGLDDHEKALPPGEYTIAIDAAREHGTYQNLKKTVMIQDKPFTEDLGGNIEIKSATITYRKKSPAK